MEILVKDISGNEVVINSEKIEVMAANGRSLSIGNTEVLFRSKINPRDILSKILLGLEQFKRVLTIEERAECIINHAVLPNGVQSIESTAIVKQTR